MENTNTKENIKMPIYFSKKTLWQNQAPAWNFELDQDELLAKALELEFVKQVGNDKYEINEDYIEQAKRV
jgi:hypothetical protein